MFVESTKTKIVRHVRHYEIRQISLRPKISERFEKIIAPKATPTNIMDSGKGARYSFSQ